ncbi:TetR/AcrR family transcriptional regulator [Actinoplanes sp. G11-F43]|uniref:TetR/AcrR family transcriptional regulator n=1 Tax=Actinoplanes sp. G11-F43 TaxID=3424130 RepID=UPI003D3564FE
MTVTLTQSSPALRSDARDNRERILAAARELFAEDGLDVPMREVARRAGVGPATLYRRFPTKEALVTEAFAEQNQLCTRILDRAAADPDPWRGLCSLIEEMFAFHARDRGFTAAFHAAYPQAVDRESILEHGHRAISGIAVRAKAAGTLRPDFTVDDFLVVLRANSGLRPAESRRFAELAIRGFRAAPA